jgi:L-alanine-DL-glutamate epimerase-like enolase superfamily enzyme
MLDAWTGWELDYAVEMTRALEPFGLAWIEEPLAANRVEAHRALKAATRIPIATGEHVFTRWGIKPFLDAGAVDIVQFDICWTGGLTESVKVCALAAAHDRPTVPHGGNLAATLHLLFAQPPWLCPWISYVPKLVERSQAALHPLPEPVGGVLAPPPGPGLGIRFDPDRIAHRAAVRWDG